MKELPEPPDAADALAVALCHLQADQLERRFGLRKSSLLPDRSARKTLPAARAGQATTRDLRIQPVR
jgi:hypothetical protein